MLHGGSDEPLVDTPLDLRLCEFLSPIVREGDPS